MYGEAGGGGPSAVLLNTGALDLDFPASDGTWRAYLEVSNHMVAVVAVQVTARPRSRHSYGLQSDVQLTISETSRVPTALI